MVLELYFDFLSQPSRSLYMFLKATGTKFEPKPVSIMKGEHKTKDYKKLNEFGTVPLLKDGSFTLTESVAQAIYIVSSQKSIPDSWYPKDPKKHARMDEYLSWHHTGLRKPCLEYFIPKLCTKMPFTGPPVPLDDKKEQELRSKVEAAMKTIVDYFLNGGKKLFIGDDKISVPDLFAYNELKQMMALGKEDIYTSNKTIGAWMKRIEDKMGGGLMEEALATLKFVKSQFEGTK